MSRLHPHSGSVLSDYTPFSKYHSIDLHLIVWGQTEAQIPVCSSTSHPIIYIYIYTLYPH